MRKIGILGTGGMGRTHARQYAKMDDVLLHFYETNPEKSAGYAEEYSATPVSSSDELIETVDVVDICLPTHLHYEYAEKAMRAGKPVFCEKPLCRTSADCAKLVQLSEETGVPIMPAQVVRYFPEFRKAHDLVKEGAIGTPAAIRSRRGGKYPAGSQNWFGDFELSGGVIMDLMIHDFDWIRWTFGEVREVYAQSLTFSGRKDIDYALATLTLESGALAHVEGTWADPGGFRVTFEAAGSGGIIEHDTRSSPCLRVATADGVVAESPLLPKDDPYYLEIRAFLDSLDSGGPPPVTAVDGMRAVAICEAAIESVRGAKPVRIAP